MNKVFQRFTDYVFLSDVFFVLFVYHDENQMANVSNKIAFST